MRKASAFSHIHNLYTTVCSCFVWKDITFYPGWPQTKHRQLLWIAIRHVIKILRILSRAQVHQTRHFTIINPPDSKKPFTVGSDSCSWPTGMEQNVLFCCSVHLSQRFQYMVFWDIFFLLTTDIRVLICLIIAFLSARNQRNLTFLL